MVQRKFNQTGRHRILESEIVARLEGEPNENPLLTVLKLDLDDSEFPDNAHVFIEAYRPSTSSWERHSCGMIRQIRKKKGAILSTTLKDFIGSDGVTLRVKVVDLNDHRILAEADKVSPHAGENEAGEPLPEQLIKYRKVDLGERLWDLHWPSSGPEVRVHFKLPNAENFYKFNWIVSGCILPSIFDEVLSKLFHEWEGLREEKWAEDWVQFSNRFCEERDLIDEPFTDEDDLDERDRLKEGIIRKFCQSHKLMSMARNDMLASGAEGLADGR